MVVMAAKEMEMAAARVDERGWRLFCFGFA